MVEISDYFFFGGGEIHRDISTIELILSYLRVFSTTINCLCWEGSCLCYYEKNGMWFYAFFFKKKKFAVKNNPIINVDLSELIKKIKRITEDLEKSRYDIIYLVYG